MPGRDAYRPLAWGDGGSVALEQCRLLDTTDPGLSAGVFVCGRLRTVKCEELEVLCNELNKLIESGPGKNERALSRVEAIAREIERASDHSYVREKIGTMVHDFKIWFSPRRWSKYGPGGNQMKGQLYADVHKVQGAMGSFGALSQSAGDDAR